MIKTLQIEDLIRFRETSLVLKRLEEEHRKLEQRVSVRVAKQTPFDSSLPTLIYNITAESYFINNKIPINKQGHYRAPNTEIVKNGLFNGKEIQFFKKIIPGYVEIVSILPNENKFLLLLNFFRDNDFRRMYLRGLFCSCNESFKDQKGNFLSPEKIREIYLQEYKRG